MKRLIAITLLFLGIPLTSLAVDGTFIIPSWTDPSPSQSFLFSDSIVVNGTWQLPPDWAGNIYVYMDAPVDGLGNPTAEGTQKTDLNTGLGYYSMSNAGGLASSSGAFSINLGPQADGSHNVYIKFVGGEQCAVNKQVNAQTGSNFLPVCDITADNLIYVVWQPRNFTVGLPLYPRMIVTPSTDPALNYSNVVFGSSLTQSFTIQNTGAQTLSGTIGGLAAPFSCGASCGYTVNPGASVVMNITYTPQVINDTQSFTATFSCIGSSLGCDAQPYVTTFQNRNIVANSVSNAIAPVISISPTSINYGNLYLGVSVADRTITITNTGGGILNGVVTFNTTEYSCTGNPTCSYSILAGGTAYIYIHYVPVAVGTHADSASFTGGLGAVVPLDSVVSDLPIVNVYNTATSVGTPINFGTVNVGSCVTRDTYIKNAGSGLLSGDVTISPAGALAGFSCIAGCSYSNYTNADSWKTVTFQFCPTTSGSVSETALFSNILNPIAGGSISLTANGNNSPIGAFVGVSSFTFGSVLVNASKTATVTFQNTGVGNLSGSVGVLPFSQYTCTSGCTYNVPPGGQASTTLTFIPTAVQAYDGSVVLSNVGTSTITGAGVKPDFQMSYSGSPLTTCPGTTCVTEFPQTYPRGDYDVGVTTFGGALSVQYKTFYLYVANKGSGANVNYTLPSTAHFICLTNCTGALVPSTASGITATYEFRPDAATTFTEPLVVTYDYGDGIPLSVTLTLTGSSMASPYLSLVPNANIPLGNVSVGNTATATFTVTNLGFGPLSGSVTIPALGAVAPSAGLVHHWTFDDADINWTTHSATDLINGNTARISGPISAAGPKTPTDLKEAVSFINNYDIMLATPAVDIGSAWTISGWFVKPSTINASGYNTLTRGTFYHHILLNSSFLLGVYEGGFYSSGYNISGLSAGWHQVVAVGSAGTTKFYVDGVYVGTSAKQPTDDVIGVGDYQLAGQRFAPSIDDVRIYNRAFTASEVTKLYNNTFTDTFDLLAHWSFDDPTIIWSQLKVTDISGKGHNLILPPVPVGIAGRVGQALNLGGKTSDTITTTTLVTNPVYFSVGAWFKTSSFSGKKIVGYELAQHTLSTLNDRVLYVGTDGKVRFGIQDSSYALHYIVSSAALNDDQWHHALGTYDNTTKLMTFYIDGVSQGSQTFAGTVSPRNYNGYWRIGGHSLAAYMSWPYSLDGGFTGGIDDVRIYTRALTATEAADLYTAGVNSGGGAFTCVTGCLINNLAYNSSQQVEITFVPTLAQSYVAYPSFLSDGGNFAYPTIPYPSITGNGVLDPIVTVTPTSITFPDTNQGLTSQFTITIENTGAGNLSGSISPVKSPGLNFYCLSGCNYNIPAGGSATAVIEFAPQSVATLSGTITLNSNAINGQQTIAVSGRGILAPIISLSGADTDYGSVIVGKYKDLNFTIENQGTAPLGSGFFDVTGEFSCVGTCTYNIGAGQSVTVTIRFSPLSIGAKSGSVSLSGVPLARFFVNGVGVSPTVKYIEQ